MKIKFLGAGQEVGRSCILVNCGKRKILLDCGIKLGGQREAYPNIDEKLAKKIDAVIITHAHLDHCGFLPHLYAMGYHNPIYATKPTRDLAHLLLADYMRIAKSEHKKIFTNDDLIRCLQDFKYLEYYKKHKIFKNTSVTFHPTGHILGSCGIRLQYRDTSLYYTGDLSGRDTNLLDKADSEIEDFNYLIIESTYGGKNDIIPSLKSSSRKLADLIKSSIKKGGTILIPAFGVGRSQEVMIIIDNYMSSGYLPSVPCFVDGMIKKANRIYRSNVLWLKEEIPKRILLARDDPFESKRFQSPRTKDRSDVLRNRTCLIVSTSGMLTGGPVLHYFERLAKDPKNTLILVGYQAEGTLGRELVNGNKYVFLPNGNEVDVRMKIKQLNFSSHADRNQLVEFVSKIPKPGKIFLVHGDREKMFDFAKELKKKYRVITPKNNEEFSL